MYIFFLSKIKEFCISIIQALSTVLWPGTGILFSWSVDGARYMKKTSSIVALSELTVIQINIRTDGYGRPEKSVMTLYG